MAVDLDDHLPGVALGDEQAFARWLAGAEPALRRSLASFAARADVESVLQETLLRVWQVAPRFQRDGAPNGSLRLARRIAHNLAVDALRRSGAEAPRDADEEAREQAIEPVEADPFLRAAVQRCHGELPGPPRRALDARLADGGGRSDRALAEALGMRLNTFLQNVTRARQLLGACLERRGIRLAEVWR